MNRVLVAVVLVVGAALPALRASAQAPAAPAAFSVSDGLQQDLARRVGEKVELVLASGKSLAGTVKAVGPAGVHLGALEGKEFYDALVRVDQISAVVVRAR